MRTGKVYGDNSGGPIIETASSVVARIVGDLEFHSASRHDAGGAHAKDLGLHLLGSPAIPA